MFWGNFTGEAWREGTRNGSRWNPHGPSQAAVLRGIMLFNQLYGRELKCRIICSDGE